MSRLTGVSWIAGVARRGAGGLVALSVLLTGGGCAVGRVGTVVAKVTPVRGGWVMDVHAIGLYIRPTTDDLGASLGHSRRSYLVDSEGSTEPTAGWHLFLVPSPPAAEILVRDAATTGVDVRLTPETGTTLGFVRVTASRPADPLQPQFRHVIYDPAHPELSCVNTTTPLEDRC